MHAVRRAAQGTCNCALRDRVACLTDTFQFFISLFSVLNVLIICNDCIFNYLF